MAVSASFLLLILSMSQSMLLLLLLLLFFLYTIWWNEHKSDPRRNKETQAKHPRRLLAADVDVAVDCVIDYHSPF